MKPTDREVGGAGLAAAGDCPPGRAPRSAGPASPAPASAPGSRACGPPCATVAGAGDESAGTGRSSPPPAPPSANAIVVSLPTHSVRRERTTTRFIIVRTMRMVGPPHSRSRRQSPCTRLGLGPDRS